MAIVSTELEVQDITTLPKRTASGIDPDTDFVLGVEENGVAYKADIEDLGQSIVQGAKSNLLGRNQTVASAFSMLREETNEKIKESYGAPLVATTILEMTDKKRVYVYTGDESGMLTNRWYYWNGSEWQAGGLYFSGVIATDDSLSMHNVPADAKAVGDALNEVNTELSSITDDVEQLQEDSSGYAASTSIAPEYSPSGIYAVGDYCMHDGALYRCTTAIATAEAWNASHWTADNVKNIADGLKGDVSDLKDDLDDNVNDLKSTLNNSIIIAGNSVIDNVSQIPLEWESGTIIDGIDQPNSKAERSRGFIPVFDWATLKIKTTAADPSLYISEYDKDQVFLHRYAYYVAGFLQIPQESGCKFVRISTYSATISSEQHSQYVSAYYENTNSLSKLYSDFGDEVSGQQLFNSAVLDTDVKLSSPAYEIGATTNNDGNATYIFKDIVVQATSDDVIHLRCENITNAPNTSPLTIYQYDVNNTQLSSKTYTKALIIKGVDLIPLNNAVSVKIRLYPSLSGGLTETNAVYTNIIIYVSKINPSVDYISGFCAPCAIGDSLTAGWSPSNVSGVSNFIDSRWSWATQLFKKINGTDVNIIARSGATAKSILADFQIELSQVTNCDCVCVYLGTNQDYNGSTPYPIGDATDIVENWNDTPTNTFIGWYSKLLKTISHYNSQYAFQVCFGLVRPAASARSNAIKLVCDNISGWVYQDTTQYEYLLDELTDNTDGTHFTPVGYAGYKEVFRRALNTAIIKNPTAVNKTANVFAE